MEVLFVTSFAEDMYIKSGKGLLESYINTSQQYKILVCYENFDFKNDNVISYPLHESEYLKNWLEKNKNIIPKELGGTGDVKKNVKLAETHNRKASRWFRKIASLKYALDTYGKDYKYIIWIDSDCYFKKNIDIEIIEKAFNNKSMFYYQGKKRNIIDFGFETGFVGFKNPYDILQKWINAYEKEFIKFRRWDDGYVLRKVCEKIKKIDAEDLNIINNQNPISVKGHIFYDYIFHNKGLHKKAGIMKNFS